MSVYTLYPGVPVHSRGCQSISWWCLCIAEGACAYPGGVCSQPRVPVHIRGCLCIAGWCLCITEGACAQPGCLCSAGVPVHSRGACAQPGCLCIAGVSVHSRGCLCIAEGACAQPGCLCIAEGARALLRSALRHPRLQKIASSRRGNNCYVHLTSPK